MGRGRIQFFKTGSAAEDFPGEVSSMEKIIVIRAIDPDGSVFKAVMDVLKNKGAEVVSVAAPVSSVEGTRAAHDTLFSRRWWSTSTTPPHFNPHSPYRERRLHWSLSFQAAAYFDPRSPYGERRMCLTASSRVT